MLDRTEYKFVTIPESWPITGQIYPVRNESPAIRGEDFAFLWEAYWTRVAVLRWSENSWSSGEGSTDLTAFVRPVFNGDWGTDFYGKCWYSLFYNIKRLATEEISWICAWLVDGAIPSGGCEFDFGGDSFDAVKNTYAGYFYLRDDIGIAAAAGFPLKVSDISYMYDIIKNTQRIIMSQSFECSLSGQNIEESGNVEAWIPHCKGSNVLISSGIYTYDRPDVTGDEESANIGLVATGVSTSISVLSLIRCVNYIGVILYLRSSIRTDVSGVMKCKLVWLPAVETNGVWGFNSDDLMAEARAFYDSVEAETYRENMYTSTTWKSVSFGAYGVHYIDVSLGHAIVEDEE